MDWTPDEQPCGDVAAAIADAVTADTRRQDLLLEYAAALGPDPRLADLDDAQLEQAVRVGASEIAAATCRWLGHLAELVVRGVWAVDGARSPAAWLSWALGMAPSTAREHVRVALRLRECPKVRDRMAGGTISYSKVRAITRVATPETEQLLLDWADAAPAHVLERIISDTRRQQRSDGDDSDRSDLGVTRRWRDDGTFELVLRTDAGTGLAIDQHLDRLLDLDAPREDDESPDADVVRSAGTGGGRVPRSQRAVDLVAGALAAAVDAGPTDTSGGDRHLVVVHATPADLLADATDGDMDDDASGDTAIDARADTVASEALPRKRLVRDGRGRVRAMSPRTLWRLACSASLDLCVDDAGHPADLGRARRGPDARLRRLLAARDRSCRFPGCGATRFLHAHHVVHWQHGGATDLDNLLLLCNHHHRTVHEHDWELRPAGRGRWTFHRSVDAPAHRWAAAQPPAPAEALLAAARAHAHDVEPGVRRSLEAADWDGLGYDHELTVELLADRLARAA